MKQEILVLMDTKKCKTTQLAQEQPSIVKAFRLKLVFLSI